MKYIIVPLLILFCLAIGVCLTSLAVAFVLWELDLSKWEPGARMIALYSGAILGGIVGFVSVGVFITNLKENKDA